MRNILRWVVGVPVALVVIAFAIANRQYVTLSLDPLTPSDPFASVEMPLWLLFFLGIITGVIMGWIGCWFGQGHHRRSARDARAEVARLQRERDALAASVRPEPAADQHIVPMGSGWV